jgi:hypothetical protein
MGPPENDPNPDFIGFTLEGVGCLAWLFLVFGLLVTLILYLIFR